MTKYSTSITRRIRPSVSASVHRCFCLMEGSQYTFKLVQLCTPEPNKLVVMYDKRQRRLLCLRQVYTLFVDGLCNYQAFYRACCKQSSGNLTLLCGGDKQMLVKLGGLKACVPNVALVSLAACCKILKICKVHATVLSAVEQLRLNPGSVTVLALPDHVLASCVVSSPDQCELQMTTPFPVTLPLCQLPADYKQKHGLHAKNQHLVLKNPFVSSLCSTRLGAPTQFSWTGKAVLTAHGPGRTLKPKFSSLLGIATIIIRILNPACSCSCPPT